MANPIPQNLFNFVQFQEQRPRLAPDGVVRLVETTVYDWITSRGAGFSWTYPGQILNVWTDRANMRLRTPLSGLQTSDFRIGPKAGYIAASGTYEATIEPTVIELPAHADRGPGGIELYGRAAFIYLREESMFVGEPVWLNAALTHITVGRRFADGVWVEPRNGVNLRIKTFEFPPCPRGKIRRVPGIYGPMQYPSFYATCEVPLA